MIYLSGGWNRGLHADVGLMLTPRKRSRPQPDRPWAADNGCYAAPHEYTDAGYLAWLESLLPYVDRCLFATAPDVVADAAATIARSLPMLPQIRAVGYPAALVAQDGLVDADVPWDMVDALFIGGTTAWKMSDAAAALVQAANDRGKWSHVGRVNSMRRMMRIHAIGARSVDGNHLTFRPDKYLRHVNGWAAATSLQPALGLRLDIAE